MPMNRGMDSTTADSTDVRDKQDAQDAPMGQGAPDVQDIPGIHGVPHVRSTSVVQDKPDGEASDEASARMPETTPERKKGVPQKRFGPIRIVPGDIAALALGLLGFAGTYASFSFEWAGIRLGVEWSLFLPAIAILALGRRGALIACVGGLYAIAPFIRYADNRASNMLTALIFVGFFLVQAHAAACRCAGRRALRYRIAVVQSALFVVVLALRLSLVPILAPGLFTSSEILIVTIKWAVNGLIALYVAEGLLTVSLFRLITGLPWDASHKWSGMMMLGCVGAGMLLVVLLAGAGTHLLGWHSSVELWERPVSDLAFMGWLILSFLVILGGLINRFRQKEKAGELLILADRNRYRRILENIEDIYFESTPEGVTLDISPSVEHVFGKKREDMIGKKGRMIEEARRIIERDGRLHHLMVRLPNVQGDERIMSLNSRYVQEADGEERVIGILRDVTELEHSREALVRLNEELEERVRTRTRELTAAVRELEDFSHTVSHDLKAPVRSIDGYSQFMLEDYGERLPAEVREMLGSVRDICESMLLFIQRLLEYATVARMKQETLAFDSAWVVAQVVAEYGLAAGGDDSGTGTSRKGPDGSASAREIVLDIAPALPRVIGDPTLFRQILANGLSNALKFTREREQTVIRIGCVSEAGMAHFSLADNGIGFEPEEEERVFEIFHRLHMPEEFEGAGVGLATVRKCAERQGGHAWIEGRPGEGATLHFTLPMESDLARVDGSNVPGVEDGRKGAVKDERI